MGVGTLVPAVGVGVLLEAGVVLLDELARLDAVVEDVQRQRLAQLVGVGRAPPAVVEVDVRVEDGEEPALQRGERAAPLALPVVLAGGAPVLDERGVKAEGLLDVVVWSESGRERGDSSWPPEERAREAVHLPFAPLDGGARLLEGLGGFLVQLHLLEIFHEGVVALMYIFYVFVIAVF